MCGTVIHCAVYEESKVAGGPEIEHSVDRPFEPSPEELISPADPLPLQNETLTAIHHGHNNRAAGPSAPLVTSDKNVQALIVGEVNRIRKLIPATNMMKMSWDSDAAAKAQNWANGCKFAHPSQGTEKNTFLTTPKYGLGQNIAMGTGSMTWNQTIKMWYDEVQLFKFGAAPAAGAVVGHYTALVWSSSYAIGCGYKLCPAGTMSSQAAHFFVCNFGPAGNMQPNQYKPYEAGTRCGKCTKACDDGLCTNPCPFTNDYSNCEVASGMQALFPNGCANTPPQYEPFKLKCKATCQCKAQGLLY